MPRKSTGQDALIQVKVTKRQKEILAEYAASQGTTIAEVTRQQLRPLIARIVSGQQAA